MTVPHHTPARHHDTDATSRITGPKVRVPVPLVLSPAYSALAVVLYALIDALTVGRPCSASAAWLAARLGVSRASVTRALAELGGDAGDGRRVFVATVRTIRTAARSIVRGLREPYVCVPLWSVGRVSPRAWRVYVALLWWRRPGCGTVGYTRATMADRLGVSVDTLDRCLAELVEFGLVVRVARPGAASTLAPVLVEPDTAAAMPSAPVERVELVDHDNGDDLVAVDSGATLAVATPAPAGAVDGREGAANLSHRGTADLSHARSTALEDNRTTDHSPAVGDSPQRRARVGSRPAAAGTPSTSARHRRRRPGLVDATGVGVVLVGLPVELAALLPDRVPARLVDRITVELDHRTPVELVDRAARRWAGWGYAAALYAGRLRDPVAVATTILRQACPDLRCDDGLVVIDPTTGATRPCELCADRARDRSAGDHSPTGWPPPAEPDPATTAQPAPTRRVIESVTPRSRYSVGTGPDVRVADPGDRVPAELREAIAAARDSGVRNWRELARIATTQTG